MPLLFYAPISRAVALSSATKPMRGHCFALLAESVRAYCTHLPEMAAGRETAPSEWRNPSSGLGWNKLQADAGELLTGVERWST